MRSAPIQNLNPDPLPIFSGLGFNGFGCKAKPLLPKSQTRSSSAEAQDQKGQMGTMAHLYREGTTVARRVLLCFGCCVDFGFRVSSLGFRVWGFRA